MELTTVLTIILGSSVLGAVITNAMAWYIQRQSRDRHNSFLALTLAHKYESYASLCAEYLSDHDIFEASKGTVGNYIDFPPTFELTPDTDFDEFNLELLDTVLEFPGKVRFACDEIDFYLNIAGHDDATQTAYKNTATLGIEALSLARRLREQYDLPPRLLSFGKYDLKQTLEELKARINLRYDN